jgi:hypothetical protein
MALCIKYTLIHVVACRPILNKVRFELEQVLSNTQIKSKELRRWNVGSNKKGKREKE